MELKLLTLLLVVVPLLVSNSASSQYVPFSCDPNNVTYEFNSTFANNLNSLLESLSIKTFENKGFYSTSYGNGSDKVYGRALCRGDIITSATCKTCLANASKEIIINCREQSAFIWLEKCQIEYSYGVLDSAYGGKYPEYSKAEKASHPDQFCYALEKLFPKLSGSARSSELMFAAGKLSFPQNETLYGLVQCTRDIDAETCSTCLGNAFRDLGGCESSKGGAVTSRTCNLRFELHPFFEEGQNDLRLHIEGHKNKHGEYVAIAISATIFVVALAGFYILCKWRTKGKRDEENSQSLVLQDNVAPKSRVVINEESCIFTPQGLPLMEFSIVEAATGNFSDLYKLGEGGFGTVYKGVLPDGKEIAVKRLSRTSWQGSVEFMNEIRIIAKLQHRNLVRLLSCSLHGSEKLLVYEYMPNKSLDILLFDTEKRMLLDWKKRMNIITGIARGLVYLHEESRIKIVHRDLKPSNVLLDLDMSAKISDFGLARIFCDNQNPANTKRVVGTYGYMAPEYAMGGVFSAKSDVFSFGVILLEIISGKRNSHVQHGQTLLAYAWGLWKQGEEVDLVDPMLKESCPMQQVGRCIQIGLVCVQEDLAERPTMSQVLVLLESELAALPHPNKPAFSAGRHAASAAAVKSSSATEFSMNRITISSVMPR